MKAVTLLSGGLDSTVALAAATRKYAAVRALFFDYGQRAVRREEKAAKQIARFYGVCFQKIDLPWLAEITTTALVRHRVSLPTFAGAGELDERCRTRESAKAVWVPNRNGVFINIAASVAESVKASVIITGFDLEEAATFPDNSLGFIRAANRALSFSTLHHASVESPVARMSKTQIVKLGLKLGAPLQRTWSCYEGRSRPCGTCESCQRAQRAFRAAGYEKWQSAGADDKICR